MLIKILDVLFWRQHSNKFVKYNLQTALRIVVVRKRILDKNALIQISRFFKQTFWLIEFGLFSSKNDKLKIIELAKIEITFIFLDYLNNNPESGWPKPEIGTRFEQSRLYIYDTLILTDLGSILITETRNLSRFQRFGYDNYINCIA